MRPVWGRLDAHRRDWGVAMDNRAAASDPKHYVHAGSGERFPGHVAFLDVVQDPGSSLGALAVPVDAARLDALDAREVNYDRHDVTAGFAGADGERLGPVVWVYRGTGAGRERARRGAAAGDLVVSRGYVRDIARAFDAQPDALPAFGASTVPPGCPSLDLDLVARPELLGY